MQEMLHHSGATADYHRLMSRLSPDRLAVAMPYTSTRLRSNVGEDGSLTFLSASPATIACLAVLLPETDATTLVLSGMSACWNSCQRLLLLEFIAGLHHHSARHDVTDSAACLFSCPYTYLNLIACSQIILRRPEQGHAVSLQCISE